VAAGVAVVRLSARIGVRFMVERGVGRAEVPAERFASVGAERFASVGYADQTQEGWQYFVLLFLERGPKCSLCEDAEAEE
jgi:hypothetical protein